MNAIKGFRRLLSRPATAALGSLPLALGLCGSPALGQVPELAPPLPELQNAPAGADVNAQVAGGMQVLDRGPIHEAFAEPIVDPALQQDLAKAIVPREPPEPVNEIAPEARPEGDNVLWISGYWMWDEVRTDFVWVSGVWRVAPPGRRWMPGNWSPVDGGWIWSPGFWIGEDAQRIAFLPAPPDTLEEGPSSPAPGDDFFWIPGCWVFQNNVYAWRAGYWYAGQPDWVWVPSYYCYSPSGYVYVAGYWDRPVVRRGFLYASVFWGSPVWNRPHFVYRPTAVVNVGLLTLNLFINPYRHHYYYGGFGPGFARYGLTPWSAYHQHGRGWYDPLFAYHHWHDGHRSNAWVANINRQYQRFDAWDRPGGDPGHGGPGHGGALNDHVRRGGNDAIVLSNYAALKQHGVNVTTRTVSGAERATINAHADQWKAMAKRRTAADLAARGDLGGSHGTGPHGPAASVTDGNQHKVARVHGGSLPLDGGAGRALPGAITKRPGGEPGVHGAVHARSSAKNPVGDLPGATVRNGVGGTKTLPGVAADGTAPPNRSRLGGPWNGGGMANGPAGDPSASTGGSAPRRVPRLSNDGPAAIDAGAANGGANPQQFRSRMIRPSEVFTPERTWNGVPGGPTQRMNNGPGSVVGYSGGQVRARTLPANPGGSPVPSGPNWGFRTNNGPGHETVGPHVFRSQGGGQPSGQVSQPRVMHRSLPNNAGNNQGGGGPATFRNQGGEQRFVAPRGNPGNGPNSGGHGARRR